MQIDMNELVQTLSFLKVDLGTLETKEGVLKHQAKATDSRCIDHLQPMHIGH